MSKYFIEGDTLTDIADAIRLKRDIATEIATEDMALQVSLIDGGGGGGGNVQKKLLLSATLSGATEQIPLPSPLNTQDLFMVEGVLTWDAAPTANTSTWCGFGIETPAYAQNQQQFGICARNGAIKSGFIWLPPNSADNAPGVHWEYGLSSYQAQLTGTSYGRKPANGSLYLNVKDAVPNMAGAHIEIYGYYKL